MFEKKIDAYMAHVYTALYDMCQIGTDWVKVDIYT